MVKYLDPENDFGAPRRRKKSPDLAARRQKNAQLPREEALEAARESALRVLDRTAASSGQIRQKLTKAGFLPEIAEEIVNRFCEVGLLDDQAYAAMLVRTRFQERGLVGRALVQELNRKGIAPHLQPEALAQITPEQEGNPKPIITGQPINRSERTREDRNHGKEDRKTAGKCRWKS